MWQGSSHLGQPGRCLLNLAEGNSSHKAKLANINICMCYTLCISSDLMFRCSAILRQPEDDAGLRPHALHVAVLGHRHTGLHLRECHRSVIEKKSKVLLHDSCNFTNFSMRKFQNKCVLLVKGLIFERKVLLCVMQAKLNIMLCGLFSYCVIHAVLFQFLHKKIEWAKACGQSTY